MLRIIVMLATIGVSIWAAEGVHARSRRKQQQKTLPTIVDFDFDLPFAQLPLVGWIGDEDWEMSDGLKIQVEGLTKVERDTIEDQINDGLEIEGPEDEKLLTPGRWVMCWQRSKTGGVKKGVGHARGCVDGLGSAARLRAFHRQSDLRCVAA